MGARSGSGRPAPVCALRREGIPARTYCQWPFKRGDTEAKKSGSSVLNTK